MAASTSTGRVALITGASAGIGAAAALRFAQEGCCLSLTGRNEENLSSVRKKCVEFGLNEQNVFCYIGDVTEHQHREILVEKTVEKFGKIDMLINNAGCLFPSSPVDGTMNMTEFDKMMDVNVRSLVALTQLCLPHLKASKGTIVNVSSVAGFKPLRTRVFYCMTKASVDMFTKCMALELSQYGVRVNSVNPGAIPTDIHTRRDGQQYSDQFFAKASASNPSGRNGTPEEVASAIYFYASEQSSFMTGNLATVDGGAGL